MALGALAALLRGAGLGRPCPQPPEPLLEPDGQPPDAVVRDLPGGRRRRPRAGRARRRGDRPRHGRPPRPEGGRQRSRVAGLVLLDAETPAGLRPPARPHEIRDVPGRLRSFRDRLGSAAGEAPAREPGPDARRRPPDPAPPRPEAARGRPSPGCDTGGVPIRRSSSRASRRSSSARGWTAPPPPSRPSGSRTGSGRSTSSSARPRTTGSSSPRRDIARSPSGCGPSWRPIACSDWPRGAALRPARPLVSSSPVAGSPVDHAAFV